MAVKIKTSQTFAIGLLKRGQIQHVATTRDWWSFGPLSPTTRTWKTKASARKYLANLPEGLAETALGTPVVVRRSKGTRGPLWLQA